VKIAVTGGTGFVGRNLVSRLLKDNHEITVLSNRRSAQDFFGDKVRVVSGSVHNLTDILPAFQGSQVVYHLVGIIAETRKNTFEKTVAEGTKNVVAACREAGVTKVIYLSSLGTSAEARSAYHKTKYRAEQSVINNGLEWVILRPSIIYGKSDGFLTIMSKIIRGLPFVPIFGDGKYKLQAIHIDDLTEALAQAALNSKAVGQIIDLGGPEQLEYVQVINYLKKALGKKRLNFHIPFGVIRPVAGLMELFLKPAPLTRDQLTMLKMGNTCDISKMKELFGIEPIRFEDGLRKVYGD